MCQNVLKQKMVVKTKGLWMPNGEMMKSIDRLTSWKYLRISGRWNYAYKHNYEGKDKERVPAASVKNIGFKAEYQKQNFDHKLARSRYACKILEIPRKPVLKRSNIANRLELTTRQIN